MRSLIPTNNSNHIYPSPVRKDQKYLIEVSPKFAQFIVKSIELGFLSHPDEKPNYLQLISTHSDGSTPIFRINNDMLRFHFLPNRENDIAQAEILEGLISKKIVHIFNNEISAKENLKKRFEAQLQCSSCQKLGIADRKIRDWLEIILN